jgi:hypothetical protein
VLSLRRGAGSTLECLFCDYTGPRHDVRPVGSVIPVVVNPVRPSPPLPHHAGHCDDVPTLLGARGQDVATTATVPRTVPPSTAPSNQPTDGSRTTNHYAATLEAAPAQAQDASRRLNRSRIRQDGRQLHGTARHASTRREIVRHACKLLPPWPIKGGAAPPAAGDTDDG